MGFNAGFTRHRNCYEHPYGDVIYGSGDLPRYVKAFDKRLVTGWNVLDLGYIHPNHWTALRELRYFNSASIDQLQFFSTYKCPYTLQKYSAFVPLAIFDTNVEKYFSDPVFENKPWYYEMACDKSWNLRDDDPYAAYENVEDKMSNIDILLQGSGYTSGCRISDGSWSRVPVLVDIVQAKGLLYGTMLVWHNK